MDIIKEAEDYLKLFTIDKNKYLIGVFQKGITFYKQQVRAINIFDALIKTNILIPIKDAPIGTKRMKICVVGGGIGGMTFAAVALKTGFDVILVEEKPMLLHMQHGCQTRKIHPNIYDWPDAKKDCLSPYAKIPVLGWQNDTASKVAQDIVEQYEIIHSEAQKDYKSRSTIYKSCKVYKVENNNAKMDIYLDVQGSKGKIKITSDLLIYAPGYGVELGTEKQINDLPKTPSYWRNDDYSQPLLSKDGQNFVIYGTGDGALLDLFRLKLKDFDLDNILFALQKNSENFKYLTNRFLTIKKSFEELNKPYSKGWLWKEFEEIKLKYYKHLISNYIKENWVKNKNVYIVGREEFFENNIDLTKVSLLNAFISFVLLNYSDTNINGPIKYVQHGKRLGVKKNEIEKSIVRYGTDRKRNLQALKIPTSITRKLKVDQEARFIYDNGIQLWKYSEIVSLFEKVSSEKKIEYYRPETVAICSNFISILANVLDAIPSTKQKKPKFRIALHRVIKVEDDFKYQQITSYFQSSPTHSASKTLGSTYNINRGNVGYSIQTGKSLLINVPSKKDKNFYQLINKLNLNEDFKLGKRKSFLSIPILAKSASGKLVSNLVIYMDSEEKNFFDEKRITIVHNALVGFLLSIKRLISSNQIYMSEARFLPIEIHNNHILNNNFKTLIVNLSSKYKFLAPNLSKLVNECFYSFDIVYDHQSQR